MKKYIWRRALLGLSIALLLINSLLPFSLASYGYAKESPTPEGQESVETSLSGTPSVPEGLKTLPARPKADFSKDLQTQRQNYVPGEVIVKFKREKLDVKSIFGKAQAFVFEKKFSLEKRDEIKASNIQVFRSKKSTEELVKELKSDPNVEYAQPNYIYEPTTTGTNDTYEDLLWGLDNANDHDIDAPEAWEKSEGNGTIVAVIDSGVAYNHPDLINNMWDGSSCKDENGNALGGCNSGYDFDDGDKFPSPTTSSHGTHIAGIIAAKKNNGIGIVGVASGTRIMAIKSALTTSDNVKGINFAKQNGAKIINASWACYGDGVIDPLQACGGNYEYRDQAMIDAINGFNGLFITAAGNGKGDTDTDGDNHDSGQTLHSYPCDHTASNIICVAATDQNDNLADFSDYGATSVDVGAPGTNIFSTGFTQEVFTNAVLPNFSGTLFTKSSGSWLTSTWDGVDKNARANTTYLNNDNGVITLTNPIDTTAISGNVVLKFYLQANIEYEPSCLYDYLLVEVDNNDNNWVTVATRCGEFNEYITADLGPGETNMRIRFNWHTDSFVTGTQVPIIDDISISNTHDYQYMKGTSMAAPHVAGLAALIEGYNPNLTPTQVKNIILDSGDPIDDLAEKTVSGKRINAYNALMAAAPLSSERAITAFTIPGQVGETVINEGTHTIGIIAPFGTNVTALTPTIVITGASVSPLSGVANNFTTPQTYTVTAADSSTQPYSVTVTLESDLIAPVIDSHENIGPIEATSALGAVVSYTPPNATDNIDATAPATCTPISGSTFALGLTTVTCNKTDTAGNAATPTTFTVTMVDTTAPTAPGNPSTTSPTNDSTPTWTWAVASDTVGIDRYIFFWDSVSGGEAYSSGSLTSATLSFTHSPALTSGIWYTKVRAFDATGNNTFSGNGSVLIDTSAPGITHNYPTAGGQTTWYNSDPGNVIDVDFIWGSGSPLDNAERKIGVGSFTNIFVGDQSSNYTSNWGFPTWSDLAEGLNEISLKVADTAGNVRIDSYVADVSGFLFRKDTGVPATTDFGIDANWHNNDVTVTLNCTDTLSGCAATYHTSDGTIPTTSSSTTNPFTLTTDGNYTIKYFSKDVAGNSGAVKTAETTVKIDKTKPVIAHHENITVQAASESGTVVTYAPPLATDNVDTPAAASCDPASGSTFSLGVTTVTCSKNDVAGNTATPTSFTVTVAENPPVLSIIGNKTVDELVNLTFTATATDPDSSSLTYSLTDAPTGATIDSTTGVFSFTPTESQGPGSYTLTANVTDGTSTDSEEIIITVDEVNIAPVANDGSTSTNEDTATMTALNATDSDMPADTLTYSIVSNPSHGTVTLEGNEATYTPKTNYNGDDSFTFKVSDGVLDSNTATVSITVFPVNDAPLAVNDITSTDEDTILTISKSTLLANDSDGDGDPLSLVNVSNSSNGLVVISGSNVVFTPNANFNGSASFDYTSSDGDLMDTATVTVTVNPVNDTPVVDSQSILTNGGTPVAIVLSGSDVDGDHLTYSLVDVPSNGTLGTISGNEITYTPDPNYSGSDAFTFKANDGMVDSNYATVSITVTAVDDPPVLDPICSKTIDELDDLTFTVLATDPDSSLTYSLVDAPAGATINPTTGVFSFTPTEAQGPGEYTLTVSVSDGASTDSEEITITVNEVNIVPVALDSSVFTNEDTAGTFTLNATDSDLPANILTYSIVSGVAHGVLGTVFGNQLTYTPSADYNGSDSFTFKANDGTDDSNAVTVTITVGPINDAPVANSDTASVDEDTSLTIAKSALLANDTDTEGDLLTLSSASNPVNGTASIVAGDVVFTPDANYSGRASFDYTVSDGSLTDITTVSITVNPVNDAPIANDGVVTTGQDTPVTMDLSASDIDGDFLTYSINTEVGNGTLSAVSDNKVTYTPNSSYVGSDSFTFKTNDGTVDSNIATINITVNLPPVISNEVTNTPSETRVTITWTTDHPSTSRVIYDTVSHAVLDVAPNYGYTKSTVEKDTSPKVTTHSVTIKGFTAGTTYHYRAVSHGSPEVVGDEKSFTTKNKKTSEEEVEAAVTSTTSSSPSAPSPSGCSDQKPGSAPTLVSVISSGPNEVTLTWTKAEDPVTYYSIAFGTKSGEMLYVDTFVGGRGTTSYTEKGLSSGINYFFKVRASNNCMSGDFSNELATKAYDEALSEIPEGSSPGEPDKETSTTSTTEKVLGEETVSPTPGISPVPQSQDGKGLPDGLGRRIIFFVGIGTILLVAGYCFFIRRKRE